jgi:CBS domain-containing protein
MLLKDFCTPDVVCCGPATTAQAAAVLMRQRHIGDLVVVDDMEQDRVPIGIVTDRDIVVEVIAKDLDPAITTVRSILRTPVVIAHEHEDVSAALERMRVHGVRRLPVVAASGTLAGVVTLDDILKLISEDVSTLVDIVSREQGREHRSRR